MSTIPASSFSRPVFIRTRKKAKCLTIFTHNKASPNLFLSSTKSCFLLRPYLFIFTRIISEYRFRLSHIIVIIIYFSFFFRAIIYYIQRFKKKNDRFLFNIETVSITTHTLPFKLYTAIFPCVLSFFQSVQSDIFQHFYGRVNRKSYKCFTFGFILKTLFCTSTK